MYTYSQLSFSSSTRKRDGVCMCKLGMISQERLKTEVKLLLSANRKSYMPRRLAEERMTLSDLECPFHASHAICAVAKLLVIINRDSRSSSGSCKQKIWQAVVETKMAESLPS